MPRKKTRRKEGRKIGSAQRAKPSTPTQAIDASMGEEGKNRKQKEEKEKNGNLSYVVLKGHFLKGTRKKDIREWIALKRRNGIKERGETNELRYCSCYSYCS